MAQYGPFIADDYAVGTKLLSLGFTNVGETAPDIEVQAGPDGRNVWVTAADNPGTPRLDAAGDVVDMEFLAVCNPPSTGSDNRLYGLSRLPALAGDPAKWFRIGARNEGARISKYVSGSFTSLHGTTGSGPLVVGQWYAHRGVISGTSASSKWWTVTSLDSPLSEEPTDANATDFASVTDTELNTLTGGIGFYHGSAPGYQCAWFSFGTAGDPAPEPAVTDTTAPTLTAPTGAASSSTTADGTVDTNEANGTLYWVVSTSATAPSVAQIQAGQDSTGAAAAASGNQAVSATGTQNVSASGLTASTTYYFHFQHQDAATNDSTVASSTSFTTAAASTPVAFSGPIPDQVAIQGQAFSLDTSTYFSGSETPFTYAINAGVLPSGLTLDSNTGVISGTPDTIETRTGIVVRATDSAANTADSNAFEILVDAEGATTVIEHGFDTENMNPSFSTVDNATLTEPTINLKPRGTNTNWGLQWRHFSTRIDGVADKRPVFKVDMEHRRPGITGWRPWYSYDNVNWTRWDSGWTGDSNTEIEFQLGTAFTQSPVYVSFTPNYGLTQAKALIDFVETNHPEWIHRLPSTIPDDPEWAGFWLTEQTNELGTTVPSQPLRSYGVWDSTAYPGDGFPKRTVVLCGGHHAAGESKGDWVLDRLIRFIVSADPKAAELRKHFQFFVYPDINPMGKFGGAVRENWDPNAVDVDPNRLWHPTATQVHECNLRLLDMFEKDLSGRRVPLMFSFHSTPSTLSPDPVTAYGYEGFESANATWVQDLFLRVNAYLPFQNAGADTFDERLGYWFITTNPAGPGYLTTQQLSFETHLNKHQVNLSDWADYGEAVGKGIADQLADATIDSFPFTGNYIAETLNGSATVGRQLDAAVYPWPPSPGDTPVKVERGLGADSSRAFRMDMGNDTGDVFVVLSSVDYEAVNDDAAAGANKVTVRST